jgi:hypothetical protein
LIKSPNPIPLNDDEGDEEMKNETISFSQTGGFSQGDSFWLSSNATYPFYRIIVTNDDLSLVKNGEWVSFFTVRSEDFFFRKSQITRIKRIKRLFDYSGIQIEHSITGYPPRIIFWTFGYSELRRHLEKYGYTVSE